MSAIKSVSSLATSLKVKPKISRKHLSRYSWLPDVLRVEGSVAIHILGPVLTVTIFATLVAYAWFKGHRVTLTNSVTPLLSVVVGLILVFRNGTSYDRYYEGRKDFGQMTSNIRNLSRLIWVNVAVPPDASAATQGKGPGGGKLTAEQLRKKKRDTLKLCVSFAYAVKHHLREEPGLDYDDYRGVLPSIFARYDVAGYGASSNSPSSMYATYNTADNVPSVAQVNRRKSTESTHGIDDDHTNAPEAETGGSKKLSRHGSQQGHSHGIHFHSHNVTLSGRGPHTPLLADSHRTVQFHPYSTKPPLALPLIIAHELASIVFRWRRDGYLETIGPAGTNTMNTLIQGMVDQLTNMERVANTPIPVSYGIHLKQCVTLYLFALPFTLVRELGWGTIPLVTIVAFTLMGIEGIANEIEMPFGKDKSDLPLDQYCSDLREEVEFMIDRLPEGGEGMHGYDDGEGDD